MNKNKIVILYLFMSLVLTNCNKDSSSSSDSSESMSMNTVDADMMVPTEDMNSSMMTVDTPDAGSEEMTDRCETPIELCDGSFEGPPPLNEHSGTYVEDQNMLVIFGGNTSVPENCGYPAYTGETVTWLYYDGVLPLDCGPWVRIEGAGPPGRARHSEAYGEGSVWIFGGRVRAGTSGPYQIFNDLWRFDVESRVWSQVTPSNQPPPSRYNSGLVYDPSTRSLWTFGGNVSGSSLNPDAANDLWRFDIETSAWSRIGNSINLRDRMWHNMIFDTNRNRVVIFGGADETAYFDDAVYFNDLIWYDVTNETWGRAERETAPDGRFWSQMIYRQADDTYMVFGGHDDQLLGNRNDIWSFSPVKGFWTQLESEDTYNRPANGFCDFPSDFTNVVRDIPERRNAHSFSWSQTCDHGVIFGGKTDCGAVNDVWRYEPDQGWINRELASAGESCRRWRSNPDNCSNLCF